MNNGLVKEQRMDRNGRLISRWVKPDDASPAHDSRIPRVGSDQPKKPSRKTEELADSVCAYLAGGRSDREGLQRAILDNVRPKQINNILELLMTYRDEKNHRILQSELIMAIENPKYGKALVPLLINHFDDFSEKTEGFVPSYLAGFQDYGRKFTIEQERALVNVTHEAAKLDAIKKGAATFPVESYVLKNIDLMDFTVKNTDRAQEIADIIAARKTDDVSLIRELLDSDTHRGLSRGVL